MGDSHSRGGSRGREAQAPGPSARVARTAPGTPPRSAAPDRRTSAADSYRAAASLLNGEAIHALRKVYKSGSAFPSWVRAGHPTLPLSAYDAAGVECYYPATCDVKEAHAVLSQRDPVNIKMERHFDRRSLKASFGYVQSGYSTFWEQHRRLPANVAVHCRTPVGDRDSSGRESDRTRDDHPRRTVHLINVIAPALDVAQQPDWMYFFGRQGAPLSAERQAEVQQFFARCFSYIFTCAARQRVRRIVLSLFGCHNFAQLYIGRSGKRGGHALFEEVFLVALRAALHHHAEQLSHAGVCEVSACGVPEDAEMLQAVQACVLRVVRERPGFLAARTSATGSPARGNASPSLVYGQFPDKVPLDDQTLFVNAWDPHSVAGNGNSMDRSLDGAVGRRTAVGVLCWPYTNQGIKYVPVQPMT